MVAERPWRDDHAIGVELDPDFLNGWGGQLGERRGVHSEPVLPVRVSRSKLHRPAPNLVSTPLVGSQQSQEPKVVRFHEQWHVLVEGVHGLVEELVHWFALRCRTWREHGNTVDEANSTRKPEALPLVAQKA
ncbi:hypothetical protein [Amycolatopsis magusensis]|uniref:Uncharacterized protein n=1 Tax=Amycolatopsis magusensis TaxID=882444 RepID=A0ABS4PLV3_9PSEU|nr:hypothetical protein [Amycolatopsis magusensis]MBP2179885.1 hypothetical protein [Amycolatopsis magusensis]